MLKLISLFLIFSLKLPASQFACREYLSLQEVLSEYESQSSEEISQYVEEYKEALTSIDEESGVLKEDQFLKTLKSKKVILVGDNHIFSGSQKGFAWLLKQLPFSSTTVIFEWLPNSLQEQADAFLAGSGSSDELISSLQKTGHWDFNTRSYQPLLDLSRKKNFKIVLPESGEDKTLQERDTDIIESIKIASKDSQYVVVFYGAAHLLGKNHLRQRLNAEGNLNPVVVLQEFDKVYYRNLKEFGRREDFQYVSLSPDVLILSLFSPIERMKEELKYYRNTFGPTTDELAEEYGF